MNTSPRILSESEIFSLALQEAANAPLHEDIPVGALVVANDGQIIAQAHNLREADCDPTAHAEVVALRLAAHKNGHWNLSGCKLFVTLEPCPLCMSAAMLGRISEVVYLAKDEKGGALSLNISLHDNPKLNHRFTARQSENQDQIELASNLLKNFFRQKRNK